MHNEDGAEVYVIPSISKSSNTEIARTNGIRELHARTLKHYLQCEA